MLHIKKKKNYEKESKKNSWLAEKWFVRLKLVFKTNASHVSRCEFRQLNTCDHALPFPHSWLLFKCFPFIFDILLPLSPFSLSMRKFSSPFFLSPSSLLLLWCKVQGKIKLLFQSQSCASIYCFVNKHNSITRPHFFHVKNKKSPQTENVQEVPFKLT